MKKIRNKYFILDTTIKPSFKHKVKRALRLIQAMLYKIRVNFIRVKSNETVKKYNVSVCAIFKNEAPYLKEWIEFNHIVGVEHFYLYNNNSDDDYLPVIKPYIDAGLVTLIQWPNNHAQMECYNDCISKYGNNTRWLGFIDIDEFIVPVEMDSIYDFLKPFEKNTGSVKIYWKMFGTSGLLDRDLNTLVTETFTVSWPKYYSVGKCFYNTSFGFNFKDRNNSCLHHSFWANYHGRNLPPLNAFWKVCLNGLDIVKKGPHPIQINHYFTKSYSEYAMKKAKGDVFFKTNPHDDDYFYLHEMENTSSDYSAYKYLIKLKLSLGRDENKLYK